MQQQKDIHSFTAQHYARENAEARLVIWQKHAYSEMMLSIFLLPDVPPSSRSLLF